MDDVQKQRARWLRKNATDAEKCLWRQIRSRQLNGCKFRRQHLLGPYIVDFVSLEASLIIELDGSQHKQQVGYDAKRTDYLLARGFTVLRFWNHEVLQQGESVLQQILEYLSGPSP